MAFTWMKKYRFLLAFVICWVTSSITLFCLDYIWQTGGEISIMSLLAKTFGMSIVIVIILFAAQTKTNKKVSIK